MRRGERGPPLALLLAAAVAACGMASAADRVEVPANTTIIANLDQELTTKSSSEGDAVSATVSTAVTDESCATLIPAGAKLRGRVTGVRDEGGREKPAYLALDFHELEVGGTTVTIDSARVVEANPVTDSETHDEAAKIGGGAVAGALLGGLISGEAEGAVAGGLVGAVAGTAIMLGTAHQHAYLPRGSRVRLELRRSVQVPAPSGDDGDATRHGRRR